MKPSSESLPHALQEYLWVYLHIRLNFPILLTPHSLLYKMFCNEKRPSQSLSLRSVKEPFFSAQAAHKVTDKLSEKIDFITVKTSAWHPSIIKQSSRNLENLH